MTPSTSLRDVLIGVSAQSVPSNNSAKAQTGSGKGDASQQSKANVGGNENAETSQSSAKIKPGMSYKSVIDPAVTSKPPQQPQTQPPPRSPLKPRPKPNAWAKPPSDIKTMLDAENKNDTTSIKPAPSSEKTAKNSCFVPLSGSSPAKDDKKEKNNTSRTATETADVDDDGTSPPPLSTLLGPGNSCSANSSVASSLEAPHSSANRFRHQSSSATTEDDVGYHLLNVCGQLSDEITTFMSRRALALDIRRKERSAVLNALGDTLGVSFVLFCF